MKLKEFIKQLKDIVNKKGDNLEVIMADNISVVEPVFSDSCPKLSVVITDQK
ncbi:MAG: hypothetical protein Q7S82_01790 [bacterium]|nr:hypothetical protein [bacterium]